MPRPLLGLLIALPLVGCTGLPKGTQAVSGFDLEHYLGSWYEIARLDHRFERGLDCVTADYSRREDGQIRVLNRGVDLDTGAVNEAEGRARPAGNDGEGRLKVSFFGPFYGGYNVLALDDDYQWSLVAGPSRDYLWILARTPTLEAATYAALVDEANALGFPVEALIEVEQGDACAPFR
ncbi:lipocalin family protein [Halomonas salifodinae]|uniref:lipocalin family protein n=1 Tax=Halomonas salifodinae TaxID=438745 RepID=UPI0033B99F36